MFLFGIWLVPVLMFAFIGFIIAGRLRENRFNDAQEILTVPALVVSKRGHRSSTTDTNGFTHTDSTYYVTFELDNGGRIEIRMTGEQYGMLAEGDRGQLTVQGTRYLSFRREFRN